MFLDTTLKAQTIKTKTNEILTENNNNKQYDVICTESESTVANQASNKR